MPYTDNKSPAMAGLFFLLKLKDTKVFFCIFGCSDIGSSELRPWIVLLITED
jgi:hypothetical protein